MIGFTATQSKSNKMPMTRGDRFAVPPDEEARRLDLMMRLLNAFRAREPKMTSGYIAAFLAVARHPGQGPTDYAKMLGTIQPIMSRTLLEIGKKARTRQEGLGLVDSEANPDDLRLNRYFLTSKGRMLYKDIQDILEQYERHSARK